jgi:protein required for attachment to host cells
MTAGKIPHNALIVVADGTGARFFRNSGQENKVSLSADSEFNATNLLNEGPAGKRPRESSSQETDEATLGQIRPLLHKEVQDRLVSEIGKTLTHASIADIQKALK